MELKKKHRETLLQELEVTTADYQEHTLLRYGDKCDKDMEEYYEIRIFLAGERLELIKKSLIDDEIDY
jgi:hypothetical protein